MPIKMQPAGRSRPLRTRREQRHVQWSTSLALGQTAGHGLPTCCAQTRSKSPIVMLTGWRKEIVDTGKFASLAIDVSGTPHLSYVAATGLIHSTRGRYGLAQPGGRS